MRHQASPRPIAFEPQSLNYRPTQKLNDFLRRLRGVRRPEKEGRVPLKGFDITLSFPYPLPLPPSAVDDPSQGSVEQITVQGIQPNQRCDASAETKSQLGLTIVFNLTLSLNPERNSGAVPGAPPVGRIDTWNSAFLITKKWLRCPFLSRLLTLTSIVSAIHLALLNSRHFCSDSMLPEPVKFRSLSFNHSASGN